MERIEWFKNLVAMAVADGKLTAEEVAYLALRSVRLGISEEKFRAAIDEALERPTELTLPARKEEALEMLRALVRVMAVDGELSEVEKELFAVAAVKMNVSTEELGQLLDDMLANEAPDEPPRPPQSP